MADQSVEEILASAQGGDWQKAGDFDGQVLTFVDYTVESGTHGEYFVIAAVTSDGDEVTISNGGKLAAQLQALRAAGKLPQELRVVGTKTKYGSMSYGLEVA